MGYKAIAFDLPMTLFDNSKKQLNSNIKQIDKTIRDNLVNDPSVLFATQAILNCARRAKDISPQINTKIDIRALSILLAQKSFRNKINISVELLNRIDEIRPKLSILFYQAMFDYVLQEFDTIDNCSELLNWLREKRLQRNWDDIHDNYIFSMNGPLWFAQQATAEKKTLNKLARECGLQYVNGGRFMLLVKSHYYIQQLEHIPVNEPHPLLEEVKSSEVFNSLFDEKLLMGHKIMEILIERAPIKNIDSSWLNVILSNAGDPRVTDTHPKFRKWWQYLPASHLQKVRGWLSGLDLKLFLEAIANYAQYSYDAQLKRMYPSRKAFLEGLFDKGLILETRLFVSANAEWYLKSNYKASELPAYEVLSGSGESSHKSLIYIKLAQGEMIEGSHSCYLRIFSPFTEVIPVNDYSVKRFTYNTLTSQVDRHANRMGLKHQFKITHSPELGWQKKAVELLQLLGVSINAFDVLTPKDRSRFKKKYGVM